MNDKDKKEKEEKEEKEEKNKKMSTIDSKKYYVIYKPGYSGQSLINIALAELKQFDENFYPIIINNSEDKLDGTDIVIDNIGFLPAGWNVRGIFNNNLECINYIMEN